jgi:hypothetical protein
VKLPALLFVCTTLVALAGCGSGETPPDITFTGAPSIPVPPSALVHGSLLRVGGPGPSSPHPLAGTITFAAPDGQTTTTDVDSTGRYAVSLAPGDYRITATSPQVSGQTCLTAKPVTTLTANGETTADVICSVK